MRVLGCDPSTKKLALVALDSDTCRAVEIFASDSKDMNARVEELFWEFYHWMEDQSHGPSKPDVCFVEQAVYVKNIKTTLMIDATVNAVRFVCMMNNVPCFIIDNKSWKCDILANGNASHEQYVKFAETKWGKDVIVSEDIAAAGCLALYGQRRMQG